MRTHCIKQFVLMQSPMGMLFMDSRWYRDATRSGHVSLRVRCIPQRTRLHQTRAIESHGCGDGSFM